MSHYRVEIDLSRRNSSHVQVIDLVGTAQRVLDVGCWTGDLGQILIERGAAVTGFEMDEEAAAIAAGKLTRVVRGDLERTRLSEHFPPQSFDAVIFADVLEHLTDPLNVLRDAATLLAPGGRIVISIPNVAHGSLRLALLQGRWKSTPTGLLDHTHIKFFNRQSLLGLVHDAGLAVDDLRGALADPLRTEVEIDQWALPEHIVEWVRDQPDALVRQFQLAVRHRHDDEEAAVPELIPGADPQEVRGVDRHTEVLARSIEKRAKMEAELSALRERRQRQDRRIAQQAGRVERQAERIERQEARIKRQAERIKRQAERIERLKAKNAAAAAEIARQRAEIERLRLSGLTGLARRVKRRMRA